MKGNIGGKLASRVNRIIVPRPNAMYWHYYCNYLTKNKTNTLK